MLQRNADIDKKDIIGDWATATYILQISCYFVVIVVSSSCYKSSEIYTQAPGDCLLLSCAPFNHHSALAVLTIEACLCR